jgi:hypothetical protein
MAGFDRNRWLQSSERAEFLRGFEGMTDRPVSQNQLSEVREALIETSVGQMPDDHRRFLISFEKGHPEWALIDVPGAADLPAVRWRQHNLNQLSAEKRAVLVARLEEVLLGASEG